MTDAAEVYRAMRDQRKEQNARRLHVAKTKYGEGWTEVTDHYWTRDLAGHRLDYWPSTGRWRWKGKSYKGKPEATALFIAKIEATS